MAKELKPFDKILVRNSNKGYWIPAFYGFKSKDMKHHLTSAGWQDECIPYEGNEEYLGTNKDYVCRNFPEIVESEDEKIRKQIKMFIISHSRNESGGKIDSWLAWLEKQKREEPSIADIVDEHFWEMLGDEKQGEQNAIKHNNDATINSNLNDYCCKVYSALHKENGGNLSFARLQHLANDIYKWCKEQQKTSEWSEEDEENKKTFRFLAYENCDAEDASRLNTWIENLKEQILHLRAVYEVTRLKEDDK